MGAEDFARMFGDHATAAAMLLHAAVRCRDLPEGEFRSGWESSIEEAAAWLDGESGDDRDNMQTLMEQVIGLLNGSYMLQETPMRPLGIVAPTTKERT